MNGNNRVSFTKLDPNVDRGSAPPPGRPASVFRELPPARACRPRSGGMMGLQEVFSTVFPITDTRELFSLEFVSYSHRRAQVLGGRVPGAGSHLLRAPEGHAPPAHPRGGRGGEAGQGDHRAGGLPRRAAADHRQRDLHHQRRGAGDRVASSTARPACSSTTPSTPTASGSSPRGSSRTAARGWSSPST